MPLPINIISGGTLKPAQMLPYNEIPYPEQTPSFGAQFAQGLNQGLGQLIDQFGEEQKAKRQQSLVDKALSQIPADAPPESVLKSIYSIPGLSDTAKNGLGQNYMKLMANQAKYGQQGATDEALTQGAFGGGFGGEQQQFNAPNVQQQNMPEQMPETNISQQNIDSEIQTMRAQLKQKTADLTAPGAGQRFGSEGIRRIQDERNFLQKSISDAEKLKIQRQNQDLAEKKFAAGEYGKEKKNVKPFLDKVSASNDAALNVLNSLDKMRAIREKGNLGIFSPGKSIFSKETRADRGAYDTYGSQLLTTFKAQFPRGITQGEFKKIEEKWLPKSNNTDERNAEIESAYENIARLISKKAEILESYRNEDGSLPSNIEHLVNKEMSQEAKKLKDKLLYSSPKNEIGEKFNNFPNPKDFRQGDIIESDDGTEYIHTGKGWKVRGK